MSVPRDTKVDEHMGSRRGVTHPKNITICDGDLWSPYKRTRVHNQGRRLAQQGEQDQLCDSKADLDEERRAPSRIQVAPNGRTCASLRRFCGQSWGDLLSG
jgi:hypothetical protein